MTEPIDLDAIRKQAGRAPGTPRATVEALCSEVERLRAYEAMAAELRAKNEQLHRALVAADRALAAAAVACRVHGARMDVLGMEDGEPRCHSCRQLWLVYRAIAAITEVDR